MRLDSSDTFSVLQISEKYKIKDLGTLRINDRTKEIYIPVEWLSTQNMLCATIDCVLVFFSRQYKSKKGSNIGMVPMEWALKEITLPDKTIKYLGFIKKNLVDQGFLEKEEK